MNKYGSRKFIVALLLITSVGFLSYTAMHLIPTIELIEAISSILGFAGLVLSAVAVMYPVTNVFQASKWGGGENES